jgi:signal transduction histidine kinase
LINVARHAGASTARTTIAVDGSRLCITVIDDGRGFAFEGRRDGAALAAMNLAPRMLYQRTMSLGGQLVIDSSPKGSRVDVEVPLPDGGAR